MAVETTADPDMAPAERVLSEMGQVRETDLIPLLQRLQDQYGYLPKKVMMEVAGRTGIPLSRIFGVATFYAQFYLKPHGRHTIRCCRGTACHVRGGKDVAAEIERTLDVKEGETTADMRFTFETVACLGTCFLAPVMMVDNEYYGNLSTGKIKGILKKYK